MWDESPAKECSPEQADSDCRDVYASRPRTSVQSATACAALLQHPRDVAHVRSSASSERVFSTSCVIDSAIGNEQSNGCNDVGEAEYETLTHSVLKHATDSEITTLLAQIDSWLRSYEDKNMLQELANTAPYFK